MNASRGNPPSRQRSPGRLGPATAPVSHRHVEVGGVRLHLVHYGGRGRPILLLHGVGGSAWLWHEVAPDLGDVGAPTAVDLPGYGSSQWPGGERYTTAEHVEDLGHLVRLAGWDELDIVGFSWGGLIGLRLAAAQLPVRRLAMLDIAPSSPRSATDVPGFPDDFGSLDEAVAAQWEAAPRADEDVVARFTAMSTRPEVGGRLRRDHDPHFLAHWPFRNDDCWAELEAVEIPLLIVRAADSPILSRDVAEAMVARAQRARAVEIADCGHLIPLEQPAGLAAELTRFLS